MRKLLPLLSVLMLCAFISLAQNRTITGQIKDDKGDPIPFASVKVKGSKSGTTADANGLFKIAVPDNAILEFSGAGLEAKSVSTSGQGTLVDVTLNRVNAELSTVIVTAQGIKRKPKELGYSVSTVNTSLLNNGKTSFLGPGLAGKVSGLTITGLDNSVNQNVRVVLRGNRSITGSNTALIVLDGVPVPATTLSYVNPNDIENVTVLKGGQAATLFGSDGVNGALLITTKKGARGKVQVTFTSSNSFDQVSFLPKFQNDFGSGSGYGSNPDENYRTYENQSFGNRFDGSLRPIGKVVEDGTVLTIPYSARPDEKKKVWDKGFTSQNDISISGGDASSQFYLSLQNLYNKGVVPGDELRRNTFRFNGSRDFGKIKASVNMTYSQDRSDVTFSDFFDNVLNTAAHIPLKDLRNWQTNKYASPDGYYNEYIDQPWFDLDNKRQDNGNSYMNGNFQIQYEPLSWLNFTYRAGIANTNSFGKRTEGKYTYSKWAKDSAYVPAGFPDGGHGRVIAQNGDKAGFVRDDQSYANRLNSDFIVSIDKQFSDFSTKLVLGQNIQIRRSKTSRVQVSSLVIPGVYNVGNRAGNFDDAETRESNTLLRKYAYYGDFTIGYKDFIFLHASGRLDASSSFYKDSRATSLYQYPYYGVDISLILTDAIPSLKSDVLNYAKIRGGVNKNGNDNLDVYSLDPTFSRGTGFPYGSTVGATVDNTFPDNNLKPEFINSIEAGFELAFLNSRFTLEATGYTQKSTGQIVSVDISGATGFTQARINAADSKNWGYEFDVRAQVIKGKNFSWDVNANYAYNNNKITALYKDSKRLQLNSLTFNGAQMAQVVAQVGNPFPYLRVLGYQRDSASGKVIVSAVDGYPQKASDFVDAGRTIPKHTVGLGTTLRYKNITFSANAEYRGGYNIYNGIGNDLSFTGVGFNTGVYGRERFVFPNSVYSDGSKFVDNTSITVADGAYTFWDTYYANVGEPYVTSGAFWKLRDASLSYNLPDKILSRTKFIKGVNLTVYGRNLFILLPKENIYNDPEFLTTNGNANGLGINTTGNTPPSRTLGVSLQLKF